MKLLHTSDWHLGMPIVTDRTYAADQRHAINQICNIAKEENVDGILLAGDVFDKALATQEGLRMYNEIVTHICKDLKIKLYIIAGNHDSAERIASCNELLKDSGLFIAGSLQPEPIVEQLGDVDIYMLPWISTDKVRSIYPDKIDDIGSMEDAYKVVLDDYRSKFIPGHKNILIAHAYIANSETSTSDKAATIGHATMVPSSVFDGFDYVALGHLHGPQKVRENIRYSGTPVIYSFGKEEKQEKGVVIVDTGTNEIKTVPLKQLHKRITLSGTYDELRNNEYSQDVLEGYVRIEIADQVVGLEIISILREKFKNLIEVSGRASEKENATITMTMEDLEKAETNPRIIFDSFCTDILGRDASEHEIKMFTKALDACRKEVNDNEAN